MTPTAVLDVPVDMTDTRVAEPLQLAEQARGLAVTRDNKLDAESMILALNDAEKRVREVLDPICDAANKAHKAATSKRGELLKPIEDARTYLRRECGRVQQQLEAEAAAEARRRAEEDAATERARLQAEAEAIADTGDVEQAMDVLEEADAVIVAPVSTTRVAPPVTSGMTYRDNWLPRWVNAKGQPCDTPDVRLIPVEYLKVDEVAIRRVVGAMKDRTRIAGVQAYNDRKPVGTARR